MPETIEQMCRELLLVAYRTDIIGHEDSLSPENLTSGDLCGMANKLSDYLRNESPRNRHVASPDDIDKCAKCGM